MSHIDWFKKFFEEKERGTARKICDYLIKKEVMFDCSDGRRITSVSSHLNKECQRIGGFISRELNAYGVYEYFLNDANKRV